MKPEVITMRYKPLRFIYKTDESIVIAHLKNVLEKDQGFWSEKDFEGEVQASGHFEMWMKSRGMQGTGPLWKGKIYSTGPNETTIDIHFHINSMTLVATILFTTLSVCCLITLLFHFRLSAFYSGITAGFVGIFLFPGFHYIAKKTGEERYHIYIHKTLLRKLENK